MKRKKLVGMIAIMAIVVVAMLAGCVEEETSVSTPTATPISPEESTSTKTRVPLPESFESGTYAEPYIDGLLKISLARGGFFEYEWIGKTGKTKYFISDCIPTTYNCTIFCQFDKDSEKVEEPLDTLVIPGYTLESLQNLDCVELKTLKPKQLVCKKDDKYFLIKETEWKLSPSDTYIYSGSYVRVIEYTPSTYKWKWSLIDVYVFGTFGTRFDGTISVIGEERTYTKSVEGTVPTIFGIEDLVDTISITFQKEQSGSDELAVVIYDPLSREVLNYGSTTASYGIVGLVA